MRFCYFNLVSELILRRTIALFLRSMHLQIFLCTVKDGKQFLGYSTHYQTQAYGRKHVYTDLGRAC